MVTLRLRPGDTDGADKSSNNPSVGTKGMKKEKGSAHE